MKGDKEQVEWMKSQFLAVDLVNCISFILYLATSGDILLPFAATLATWLLSEIVAQFVQLNDFTSESMKEKVGQLILLPPDYSFTLLIAI